MKYYFDPAMGVRAFESDGSQDFLISPEMRPMTSEEVEAHLNPAATEEQLYLKWKAKRQAAVDSMVVVTSKGNAFDGHELAQARMARAVMLAVEGETTPWILADNTVVLVDKAELQEALRLAGARQTELWMPDSYWESVTSETQTKTEDN